MYGIMGYQSHDKHLCRPSCRQVDKLKKKTGDEI